MATLTVVTITLNEEANIRDCLASARWANEIIVVDSGSTDRTVEYARAFTDHVDRAPWEGYGAARNFALQHATSDWIFWLDADERVTPELAVEIQEMLRKDDERIVGYSVARRAYFLGRWIKHCGWYPSRVTRLFRRGKGRFSENRVHEQLELQGDVGILRNDLLHFTDPSLQHYFAKFNKYTSLAAEDLRESGRSFGFHDVLLRPPFTFFKMYVLKRGFLDGMQGFILCVLSSLYVFTKYIKLWELRTHKHR